MALFQYSAKNVIITITPNPLSGMKPHTVLGFGEDEFFTLELSEDDYVTVVGADGTVVRSLKPNPVSTATLTLQQTSTSNLILTRLRNLDKEVMGGGVFGITVSTPAIATGLLDATSLPIGSPFDTISCQTAYVSKMSNYEYAKESGERAWSLTLIDAKFEGGNLLESIVNLVGDVAGLIKGAADVFDGIMGGK